MVFEELRERFGADVASKISAALTLEEFHNLDLEAVVSYFELRAERLYQEYNTRRENPASHNRTPEDLEEYLGVLRRRWQDAEDLAHLVLAADMAARREESVSAVRAS